MPSHYPGSTLPRILFRLVNLAYELIQDLKFHLGGPIMYLDVPQTEPRSFVELHVGQSRHAGTPLIEQQDLGHKGALP